MSLGREQTQPNRAPSTAGQPQVGIQLLGRFVVCRDGRAQPDRAFGGRLARQLLRMLTLSRGALLSKDVAIEALWPTHPPVDAAGNVEILVSRIRRALGDRSLIQTGSGGYTLVGDDRCWVDVEAFLAAVSRGQAELTQHPAAARTAFTAALALWHGEPLAEDAYAAWAVEHRHHLGHAHLDALEGAATAALAVGDPIAAVTWAQTAADEHPLREAAAMLLVRSLALSGDRAAALAAYDAFARRLGDELGIGPSADAGRLRRDVLGDGLGTVRLPIAPRQAVDGLRPVPRTAFVGRDQVRARIRGLLADRQVRVVLIRGPAGGGKSRLLDELAGQADLPVVTVRARRDRRDDPGALAAELLRTLRAHHIGEHRHLTAASPDGDLLDTDRLHAVRTVLRAVRALARPRCLLAVDDLHWADDTSLTLLRTLRQRVPGLQLIATCPTTGPSGSPDPVETLAGADPGMVRTVDLAPWAVTELAALAGPVLRGILAEHTDRAPGTVLWVLAALAGQHLVERDGRGRYRLCDPGARSRVRALAADGGKPLLRAKTAALSAPDRQTFTLLALLGRPAPASVLATAAGLDLRATLDALDALVRTGLVQATGEGWAPATTAAGHLIAADLDPPVRMRCHLLLAAALHAHGGDLAEVAAHRAAGGDHPAAATAFADAARVRLNRIADREALRATDAGLAVAPPGPTRSALWQTRGEVHRRLGRLGQARTDLRAALAEAPSGPTRSRLLAQQAIFETRSHSAIRGAELADLAIAAAGDDPAARGQALAARGVVDLWLARTDAAARSFRRAQRLLRRAGDPEGAARLLHGRTMAALFSGRLTEAAAMLDNLAGLSAEASPLWNPRATRGHTLVFLGDPARGLADIDAALAWARTTDHPETHSGCLWHRSEALSALGRHREALSAARAALATARRIEHAEATAASLRGLGIAWQTAGDLDRAELAFRDATHASRTIPLFAGWAAARLGLVLVAQGKLAEAQPHIDRALRDGAPLAAHEARWAHAALLHARGDPTASAVATGALVTARDAGYRALLPRLAALTR